MALGEVPSRRSIKYLGIQLDRRLSFGERLYIATTKAMECGANLAQLLLNIGSLKEVKRRLVANLVHSKLPLFYINNGQEISCVKKAIRKDARRKLVEKWQTRWHGEQSGRWTHRPIPKLVTWPLAFAPSIGKFLYLFHVLPTKTCSTFVKFMHKRLVSLCLFAMIKTYIHKEKLLLFSIKTSCLPIVIFSSSSPT